MILRICEKREREKIEREEIYIYQPLVWSSSCSQIFANFPFIRAKSNAKLEVQGDEVCEKCEFSHPLANGFAKRKGRPKAPRLARLWGWLRSARDRPPS